MTGNNKGLSPTPSYFGGNPNRPVEQVSWDDIQVFLGKLNEQSTENLPTGWAYVLPTEAQWEYACRAGTTTEYSWGDTYSISNANFAESGYARTRNVGQYPANPWGFFDIHGNVLEWTADRDSSYSSETQLDPVGSISGANLINRGGSWSGLGIYLRSSGRGFNVPSHKSDNIGFRLAFKQVTQQEIDLNATAQNFYAYEQKPKGTAIGVFVTDAPDRGVSNKYSLKSNYPHESNFSIRGNILYSADVFDASIQQSYEIGIDIENPDGYITSETINIWVAKDYSNRTMVLKVYGKDLAGANLSGPHFQGHRHLNIPI